MRFGSYLRNAFRTLAFDAGAVHTIRDDSDTFKHSLLVLGLLALLSGSMLAIIWGLTPELGRASAAVGLILGMIFTFTGAFIGYGMFHLLARAFGGQASFQSYFAAAVALSFAVAIAQLGVFVLALIPILGSLIVLAFSAYSMVLSVFVIREAHSLSTGRAVATYLIPVAIALTILIILIASAAFLALSPQMVTG